MLTVARIRWNLNPLVDLNEGPARGGLGRPSDVGWTREPPARLEIRLEDPPAAGAKETTSSFTVVSEPVTVVTDGRLLFEVLHHGADILLDALRGQVLPTRGR